MNKEEALTDFLKGLRVALNTAAAYPKDHPYFIKSVEAFKEKVDSLFSFMDPVKININPNSLFIDGKAWEKASLFVEIAQMFHNRKIKAIELRAGLTLDELVEFLSGLSMPTREILKLGGLRNVLGKEKRSHVSVEELDYSQLLGDKGEEVKDVWSYLLGEAVETKDSQKVDQVADNFERIIAKFKTKDLFEDEALRENIYNFLSYLKDNRKEKFYKNAKGLLKVLLRDRSVPEEEKFEKIKSLFKDLDNEHFIETLSDEMLTDDNFNYLSFEVFFKLMGEDKHKEIASGLQDKLKHEEMLKENPRLRKKIKELFSTPENPLFSAFYRHALSSLLEEKPKEGVCTFDRESAQVNYYFILLDLLREEKDRKNLDLILKRLSKECEKLVRDKNLALIKPLWDIIDKKLKDDPSLGVLLEGIQASIGSLIENMALEEVPPQGLDYFIDKLNNSSISVDRYFEKVFNEAIVNTYILKLFFKFFPGSLPDFFEGLKERHADIDFIAKIVNSLGGIDHAVAFEILKNIFDFSNKIVQMEVLRSMQGLTLRNETFLFSVLDRGDVLLKREAMGFICENEEMCKKALEKLLAIPSPFGKMNKIIIENIAAIEDMGLKQAQGLLEDLAKRRFFWNRDLRIKAQGALKKIYAR